jgi:type II secretory pathway component GspD/PulD (secretin)
VVPLIVIDDVPLTDAIRNLARQSNLNFQFDPRVTSSNQPNISIRFENVTAQEALTAVLENYNMQLVRDARSKIARVTVKDPKAEEPLVTRIIQLRYSSPTNMVTIVKSTLSPRSQVLGDGRTSQLIVSTTEKELDALMATIDKLDTATKQVLIEARLFETARKPQTLKGINWSGTTEGQKVSFGNNQYVPGSDRSVNNLLTPTLPKLLADTAKGFNPATAFLNADGVSAVISFLNKDNESDLLATPRAVTLDNQTATLSVTRAFPIFRITPGSANSPAGAEITYTNLGTILEVTPRIAADNNISLRVLPEVSDVDGQDTQVIGDTVNKANIYAIRRMETHVMIPSGHTLVMGGLSNSGSANDYTKVPIMGDIPGLGWFFRSSNKTMKKSNLLIFITPTVVADDSYRESNHGEEFLKTPLVDVPDKPVSAWDSALPHDWTKPVY